MPPLALLPLLAACALPPDPCEAPDVPTVEGGVHVREPAADLDPALRDLAGTWAGSWGGYRASRLIVEDVRPGSATVVYGIAAWGSGTGPYAAVALRYEAVVEPSGALRFGDLSFTPHRRDLVGALEVGGRTVATVPMHRCDGATVGRPATGAAGLVASHLLLPGLLVAALARRWGVRPAFTGAATWILAMIVVGPARLVLGGLLGALGPAVADGVALALSAGFVEELARWAMLRWQVRDRGGALAAGAAHGATEAAVFGVLALHFPAGPGTALAIVSRPVLVLVHVALAALVWRSVERRDPRWLALAIALHVAVDLVGFALPAAVPGTEAVLLLPALALAAFAVAEIRDARAVPG